MENSEIITVYRIKIINTTIRMVSSEKIEFSALYSCQELGKPEFIKGIEEYLQSKKFVKNHYLLGDLNIDTLGINLFTQDLLNTFSENGYILCFQNYTRPSEHDSHKGFFIVNVFLER